MNHFFGWMLPLFFFPAAALSAVACPESDLGVPSCNQYFLSIRRNQGRSIGNNASYTTLEALSFPVHSQTLWPFLDLRAHHFDKSDKYAANAGIGFRIAPKCTDQIFGINAYYDFRHVRHAHFNQVGLGLEMLGCIWNFRLNGYLPVGQKRFLASSCFFDGYTGGFFLLHEKFIDSLKGCNFEMEALVSDFCWAELYLSMGGYYYKGNKCQGNIYGTEYRLTAKRCDRYALSVVATHDCVFKTRVEVQLTWTIPLNCRWLEKAALFQPVRRHELIIVDKRHRWTRNF